MGMVGGIGKWYGPVVGALLFIPADTFLTAVASPEVGRVVFGSPFVVVILLLPRGLGRSFADWFHGREVLTSGDDQGQRAAGDE